MQLTNVVALTTGLKKHCRRPRRWAHSLFVVKSSQFITRLCLRWFAAGVLLLFELFASAQAPFP